MKKFIVFLTLLFNYKLCQSSVLQNNTNTLSNIDEGHWDDATWILNSAFVIITMQSGFGLLESGLVSRKNRVNIMMKNMFDIIFGGLSYWIFGFALTMGKNINEKSLFGTDNFFFEAGTDIDSGWEFSKYFFQLTFATTATTIVSGSLAERCKFSSYCIFSFFNTFIYSIPAHWIFHENGWLNKIGVNDFAGAGPVHVLGGMTGMIGSIILGKRIDPNNKPSSPNNAVLGLFMLWWGWLGFNCGSSFGITETKWIYVAKAASTTVNASIGGGIFGYFYCYFKMSKYDISIIINSILSALVSITPCCVNVDNWASIFIGIIGGLLGTLSNNYIKDNEIFDDPIGCFGTHAVAGIWGLISTGLFLNTKYKSNYYGLFYSGDFTLLGIQLLEIISIVIWTICISYIIFKVIDCTHGLRMSIDNENLGNDIVDHDIRQEYLNLLTNNESINNENIKKKEIMINNNFIENKSINQIKTHIDLSRINKIVPQKNSNESISNKNKINSSLIIDTKLNDECTINVPDNN